MPSTLALVLWTGTFGYLDSLEMTKWKIQNHQPSEGILLYLILYFSGMLCFESED
jgi:hypothetical protein